MAENGRILGVIHLKDIVKHGIAARFAELRRMGIRTVMITGDNPLTAQAIADEAGVDDFLAEATPEDKMAYIRKEQQGGFLVAMTGDGTNDAPALAQADVGVAMNTGTQAAKEAGNMVDLDSNPTKLIEVVEIGKQLLITRGALTTFSIANDVAKYFAIIPAMFMGVFPALKTLNIMKLDNPHTAILSAVIFNAIIIVLLIPLALRGREVPGDVGERGAAPQPHDLRRRGDHRPVRRDQAHRHGSHRARSPLMIRRQLITALIVVVVMTVALGLVYPLVMTGVAQVAFHDKANDSLVKVNGKVVGSSLLGQNFTDSDGNPLPQYFQPRPSAVGDGYDAMSSSASNLGPSNPNLIGNVPGVSITDKTNPYATPADPYCVPVQATDKDDNAITDKAGQPGVREEQGRHLRVRLEHRARTGARVPAAERPRRQREGPGRRGDRVGIGSRSGHLDRQRRSAGRRGSRRHVICPLDQVMSLIKAHTDGRIVGVPGREGRERARAQPRARQARSAEARAERRRSRPDERTSWSSIPTGTTDAESSRPCGTEASRPRPSAR